MECKNNQEYTAAKIKEFGINDYLDKRLEVLSIGQDDIVNNPDQYSVIITIRDTPKAPAVLYLGKATNLRAKIESTQLKLINGQL